MPSGSLSVLAQICSQPRTVKNIVTQDESDAVVADELFSDCEGLSESVWRVLHGVVKLHSPLRAISE